jgi:Protein of unknown function (DUF1559)
MRRPHWILLIVLLLGGLSVAWLIPAIQRVREAAARMSCHCNLKCQVIALHNYAEGHEGKFPAGTLPNPALPPDQLLSWYISLLPFIEQHDVFKQFDLERGTADPRNQNATDNRFRTFVCPSSGEYERDKGDEKWKSPGPVTHYVGVAGVGEGAVYLPLGHPRAGIFGYDRRTSIRDDIPGGTSKTLIIIETAQDPGHWAYGGSATVREVEPGTSPYIGEARPFGGFHDGGWNWGNPRTHTCTAALADGSVRSLSDAIAPDVLEALATVGGKESLPANW